MTRLLRRRSVAVMLNTHPRAESVRQAGGACIFGASIVAAAAALVAQVVQASTEVSDQVWNYPVLVAIGLLLAGWTTLRQRNWDDWRRFTPLATGAWAAALIPLQLTPALPSALAVYGLFLSRSRLRSAVLPIPP